MISIYDPSWSPYIVGALIGILSWFTFLFSNKPIGCSTTFGRFGAFIERFLRGKKKTLERPYYQKYSFTLDWEITLVIGIFIGAFLSASLSNSFDIHFVPSLWMEKFGDSSLFRVFWATIGGIIIGLGSRWAGGCTSGHGISGTLQLAASSWLVVPFFFIGGIITSLIIFNVI